MLPAIGLLIASAVIFHIGCYSHSGVQSAFWIKTHSTTAAKSSAGILICFSATGWRLPLIRREISYIAARPGNKIALTPHASRSLLPNQKGHHARPAISAHKNTHSTRSRSAECLVTLEIPPVAGSMSCRTNKGRCQPSTNLPERGFHRQSSAPRYHTSGESLFHPPRRFTSPRRRDVSFHRPLSPRMATLWFIDETVAADPFRPAIYRRPSAQSTAKLSQETVSFQTVRTESCRRALSTLDQSSFHQMAIRERSISKAGSCRQEASVEEEAAAEAALPLLLLSGARSCRNILFDRPVQLNVCCQAQSIGP